MKVTGKNYFVFAASITILSLLCLLFIHFLFYNTSFMNDKIHEKVSYGLGYSIAIIRNNTIHFLQYFGLFILSPLFIFFDIGSTMFQIYVSLRTRGGLETTLLLYKHGFIEIPNLLFYMFLSFKCHRIFFKNKSLGAVIKFWKENRRLYFFSLLFIFLAGLIEGLIG